MAVYVELMKERKANGKVWPARAVCHVPNAVGRAMQRNGLGRMLSNKEAKAHLEKAAKAKAAKEAKAQAELEKAAKEAAKPKK